MRAYFTSPTKGARWFDPRKATRHILTTTQAARATAATSYAVPASHAVLFHTARGDYALGLTWPFATQRSELRPVTPDTVRAILIDDPDAFTALDTASKRRHDGTTTTPG
jgi:hypothetical protein